MIQIESHHLWQRNSQHRTCHTQIEPQLHYNWQRILQTQVRRTTQLEPQQHYHWQRHLQISQHHAAIERPEFHVTRRVQQTQHKVQSFCERTDAHWFQRHLHQHLAHTNIWRDEHYAWQRKTEQVTRRATYVEKPVTYSLATAGLASLRALVSSLTERVAALERGVLQRPLGSVLVQDAARLFLSGEARLTLT